ncbi:MAG: hypothetical protein A2231_00895 [Candidatus Firestonebacteria bacterium RIFOXYA2_FULL_40_8]|nr:MAG: hypothetical protein A2231_00895 [Candidatus Firestonebacteria bacterium RIFOXYA2_FULL_40_8]
MNDIQGLTNSANKALSLIVGCNKILIRSTDELSLIRDICHTLVMIGEYDLTWVGYVEHDDKKTITPVAHAGNNNDYLVKQNLTWSDTGENGSCPANISIRTGKSVSSKELLLDPDADSRRLFASNCGCGYVSLLSVPLITNGNIIGTLNIHSAKPIIFNQEEKDLLAGLADDLAYGIMSIRNLAEQKKSESLHRKEKENANMYLDIARVVIMSLDINQVVTLINKEGCSVLEFEEKDIIGKKWFDNFVPKKIKNDSKIGFAMLMKGELEPEEYFESSVLTKSGIEKIIGWYNRVLKNKEGSITGLLCSGTDITEQIKMKQALAEYNARLEDLVKERTEKLNKTNDQLVLLFEEAKQASIVKSEFIANMNHELKTPLNSITGFAQILNKDDDNLLNERYKGYIKYILSGSGYLLDLIKDILDISKIEANIMELKPVKVDVREIINNARMSFDEKAVSSSIKFEMNISPEIPREIIADELRIKQVLFNLLSNAFKYTPGGGKVVIKAGLSLGREIEISVIDNGIGVKKEDQDKLFRPFSRIETSIQGTGLGLSLSKKIVNLWKGRIGMISPPGSGENGSKFYFTIPI